MVSRQVVPQQALTQRDSLVRALRKSGNNTELIAQRAKTLLLWVPSQATSWEEWLRSLLPERWHYDKVMKALRVAAVATSRATSFPPPPSQPAVTGASGQSQTRRRHGGRR